MKPFVCPQCGADLVADQLEDRREIEDGGFVSNTYPEYVCRECGYTACRDLSSIEAPNLFHYATSELSQDVFLCWLIDWGDMACRSVDPPLHEVAIDFISTIFHAHDIAAPAVESIKIEPQFEWLDILVVVNDQYVILIEDKKETESHSNQLPRYREAIKEQYPNPIQFPVY